MLSAFTRIAVVQLAYHPAILLQMRSPLEDPGGVKPLLPSDVPATLVKPFDDLRLRIRTAYTAFSLRRVKAILEACRGWGVRLVVFPEYSIPWGILEDVAQAARDMVVVAGTHMVDFEVLEAGIYERLGRSSNALPIPRQAVAPVLCRGKLLALSPKFHPATAVGEEIEAGTSWAPVDLPEDIVGPMGVMVCLDFLHRENAEHRALVTEPLAQCRFLAVPSLTGKHTVGEFAAKAWEEAKRYGRPVLYTNQAEHGGTSIFVDEEKHSDVRPFPEHVGRLEPGEEGVIVADVDLGFVRTGGSTRYDARRPVRPFAAATLVYRARPEDDAYAAWIEETAPLLAAKDISTLRTLKQRVEASATVRQSAAGNDIAMSRRERLSRLIRDLRLVSNVDEIGRLTREVVLPSDIVPFDTMCAALAKGAAEAMQPWLVEHPDLGPDVARLRKAASVLDRGTWTDAGQTALKSLVAEVRGGGKVAESPAPVSARVVLPEGIPPAALGVRKYGGLVFSFCARPAEFREATHAHQAAPKHGFTELYLRHAEDVYQLALAEGATGIAVVGIWSEAPVAGTLFVLVPRSNRWIAWTSTTDRWVETKRAVMVEGLCSFGLKLEGTEILTRADREKRARRILPRFAGAQTRIDARVEDRLREVGGQFIEPAVRVDGTGPEPALAAMDTWLAEGGQTALLLGEFGTGKSTLLARWAQERWRAPTGPGALLVNLAGADTHMVAEQLLLDAADVSDDSANRAALALLVRYQLLVPCFDGFDEMATRVGEAELSGRLAGLLGVARGGGRVVLSCRDHYFPTETGLRATAEQALGSSAGVIRRLVLQLFDQYRVNALVSRVKDGEIATRKALAQLDRTYDLGDLVRRPLLLGMVLTTLDRLDPQARVGTADVYETYLARWLEQTRSRDPECFTDAQKIAFAEALAEELWRTGKKSCSLVELRNSVRERLSRELPDDMPREAAYFEIQGGAFFVREGDERYRFAHKSLLEYFLARSLVRTLPMKPVEALTTKRLTPEVAAFVGEVLRRGGEPKDAAAVRVIQDWLRKGRGTDPTATAGAAANALLLLLGLGRWAKEPEGWAPEGADLRGVRLAGVDMQRIALTGARFDGADLTGADLRGVMLAAATLNGARLRGVRLDGAVLQRASAREADFTQVEAHGANLEGTDLSGSALRQSTWTGCRWEGACLDGADVTACIAPEAPSGNATIGADAASPTMLVERRRICSAKSPEGRYLASAEVDNVIRIRDCSADRVLASLMAPDAVTRSMTWDPSGTRLAALGERGFVASWDGVVPRLVAQFEGTAERLSFSPDGTKLAGSFITGERLLVWDAVSGRQIIAREAWALDMAWHPRAHILAHCGHSVEVLDVASGASFEIAEYRSWRRALLWSPDGRFLAGTYAENSGGCAAQIWDVEQRKEIWHFPLGEDTGRLAWQPDGRLFVDTEGERIIWDGRDIRRENATGIEHQSADELRPDSRASFFESFADPITTQAIRWDPQGAWLAIEDGRQKIRIWNAKTGREALVIADAHGSVWSPDGARLAAFAAPVRSEDEDKVIPGLRIFDATSGALLLYIGTPSFGPSESLLSAWPEEDTLVAGTVHRMGTIHLGRNGDGKFALMPTDELPGWHPAWALSPNCKKLARAYRRGSWEGPSEIDVLDFQTGQRIALKEVPETANVLVWHPLGERIAGATPSGYVRIWDAVTGRLLGRARAPEDQAAMAWHPDGTSLATTDSNGLVTLWNASPLTPKIRRAVTACRIRALAWHPSGKWLTGLALNDVVHLINPSTLETVAAIEISPSSLLTRTAEGFYVASGNSERIGLALHHPDPSSGTALYLPLAGLGDVLSNPAKVESALVGDISGNGLSQELAKRGWDKGIPWDGKQRYVHAAFATPNAIAAFSPPQSPPMSSVKLPRLLLDAYRNGKLALFVGSGLSLGRDVAGRFPTWSQLPERLLDACARYDALDGDVIAAKRARFKPGMRLENMLAELGALRTALSRDYQSALNDIFRPENAAPGEAHRALVSLGIRAILTTNYDHLLEDVPETQRRQPYTWKDADRALGDLRAGRKVLLKVHGTAEHHDTVVMSEVEYNQARADRSYQAVLSFLLQDHVMLFVGYDMNDPLDLDLALKGNADAFRTSAQRHYVLLKGPSDADRDRIEREYNVRVIPYAEHSEIPAILRSIADA
ncbi:SIR2 family protein [Polyangium fumosum]|uniref:CN hydrolase domain-containing protein n=1 Tax=Polyangium fumosum TaxID=889272 RepID=A0A4U1JDV4_9BACT|nr:SIR2 family protein [Polyangium fumosum]TKD09165.1 hypothetical protein E8A74_12835 [Polyangium fumosum]